MDEESSIPYYDDLYLDITITNDEIEIIDEDELENAYHNNLIDTDTYNRAINVKDTLISEIKNIKNMA